jgi:hypothetical protein
VVLARRFAPCTRPPDDGDARLHGLFARLPTRGLSAYRVWARFFDPPIFFGMGSPRQGVGRVSGRQAAG